MKRLFFHTIALLILLTATSGNAFCQAVMMMKTETNFCYVCRYYKDTIIIVNVKDIPKPLDTTFFKDNIRSRYFLGSDALSDTTRLPYRIYIYNVKKVSINEFEIKSIVVPNQKSSPIEILRHLGGYNYYKLKIRKRDNEWYIESFVHLYSEI